MNGKQQQHDDARVLNKQRQQSEHQGQAWQAGVLPAGLSPQQGMGLPAGAGTSGVRQAAMLQLQRQQGNAAVSQMLAGQRVQRQGPDEDLPLLGMGGAQQSGNAISQGGNKVEVTDSGVDIDANAINLRAGNIALDAGITNVTGVLQGNTIIADLVSAASYTPGAGNLF